MLTRSEVFVLLNAGNQLTESALHRLATLLEGGFATFDRDRNVIATAAGAALLRPMLAAAIS
jgi:hypothetical protein